MAKRRFGWFPFGGSNDDSDNDGGSGEDNISPFAGLFRDRLPISPDTNMEDFMNMDFGDARVIGGSFDTDDIEAILGMILGGILNKGDTRPKNGAYIEAWIMDAFSSEDNPRIYQEIRRLWDYIEIDDPMAVWILQNKMMLVHSRTLANGDTLELWDFGCITTFVWKGSTKWFPVHSIRWMSMLVCLHIMDLMAEIGYWDDALFNQLLVEYEGFDVVGTPEAARRLRQVIDFDGRKTSPIDPEHVQRAIPFLDIEDARGITPWDYYEAVEARIVNWEQYEMLFQHLGFVRFWEELKDFDPFLNAYAQEQGLTRRRKMILRHLGLAIISQVLKEHDLSPAVMAVTIVIMTTHAYDEDFRLALRHGDLASEFAAKFFGGDAQQIRLEAMGSILAQFLGGLR